MGAKMKIKSHTRRYKMTYYEESELEITEHGQLGTMGDENLISINNPGFNELIICPNELKEAIDAILEKRK